MPAGAREVDREFLLAFWKLHILHHAGERPVVGQWMMRELRRHGYEVSPGTLYPLLARMEARGWVRAKVDPRGGPKARKEYTLTRHGRSVLALLRRYLDELYRELGPARNGDRKPTAVRRRAGPGNGWRLDGSEPA
jgi:DNA-binding PadR family transcriptional regulator